MSSDRVASSLDRAADSLAAPRRVASTYVLDGASPGIALAPTSVEEVGRCLAWANAAGYGVVPWGGGTQMGLGNLPEAFDVALDLRGLREVVEYEPDDMTIAVQAAMTLGELDRLLAEHGQMLPVDAASPERATLGGLIATGMSGPRRYGYAPLRDLIIGITAVLPDGREARAGGMVVKNVSGFDLMRLYHGSLGALAVIVQVNLKVLPRPRAERTVLVRFNDLEAAARAAEAVRLSQLGVTAVVVLDRGAATSARLPGAVWTLGVRCEAPPVAVVRQAERVVALAGAPAGTADVLPAEETPDLWTRLISTFAPSATEAEIVVRLGARPSGLAEIGARVAASANATAALLDVGSGLAYAHLAGEPDALRAAWTDLARLGDHATLLTAPVAVKQGLDVFGPVPAGFEVMQALKQRFDPYRILNRGRFVGHL